jgi:spore germination protein KC
MKPQKLRRFLVWIVACGFFLMITGCKDLNEVDELNIVLAMGIDETSDHHVEVSTEIVDPKGARTTGPGGGGGQQEQATFVRHGIGNTVEEAVDRLDENVARNLFLSHNTVVVFGRAYAEHGIDRSMDYLERNLSLRRNQLWVVTDDTAAHLLEASGKPESYNATAIRSLVEQGVQKSVAVNSTQLRVMRDYLRPSHAPNIAYLTTMNSQLCECGVGLFDGNSFKDHFSSQDANGLLLFLGATQQTEFTLPCSTGESSTDRGNTFRVLGTQTKVLPIIKGSEIQFLVKVRGRAEIERLCPRSKTTPDTYPEFETQLSSEIQQRMQRVMTKLQQDDVDSVQFGTLLYKNHPAAWRKISTRWKNIFPTVKVNYDVHIQLLRNGLASKSPDTEFSPQGLPPRAGRRGISP